MSSGGSRESTLPIKGNDGETCEQLPVSDTNDNESHEERANSECTDHSGTNKMDDIDLNSSLSLEMDHAHSSFSHSDDSESEDEIDVS